MNKYRITQVWLALQSVTYLYENRSLSFAGTDCRPHDTGQGRVYVLRGEGKRREHGPIHMYHPLEDGSDRRNTSHCITENALLA